MSLQLGASYIFLTHVHMGLYPKIYQYNITAYNSVLFWSQFSWYSKVQNLIWIISLSIEGGKLWNF